MQKQSSGSKHVFLAIGALMGWVAIVLQLYLLIKNRTAPVPETIVRFFSFFTILSNILVALCFAAQLIKSATGNFFSLPKTITAVAVYITIVGIVYNIILRSIWNPQGLQLVVDELLHSVIPLFFVLYWLLFVQKSRLQWKNIFPWLLFPACYLLFILLRGSWSGFYPYPFIDVNKLGYTKVFLNSGLMLVAFLFVSLLFIGIGRLKGR